MDIYDASKRVKLRTVALTELLVCQLGEDGGEECQLGEDGGEEAKAGVGGEDLTGEVALVGFADGEQAGDLQGELDNCVLEIYDATGVQIRSIALPELTVFQIHEDAEDIVNAAMDDVDEAKIMEVACEEVIAGVVDDDESTQTASEGEAGANSADDEQVAALPEQADDALTAGLRACEEAEGDRKFCCPLCNLKVKTEYELRNHKLVVHW
jgi:hypothetical protein